MKIISALLISLIGFYKTYATEPYKPRFESEVPITYKTSPVNFDYDRNRELFYYESPSSETIDSRKDGTRPGKIIQNGYLYHTDFGSTPHFLYESPPPLSKTLYGLLPSLAMKATVGAGLLVGTHFFYPKAFPYLAGGTLSYMTRGLVNFFSSPDDKEEKSSLPKKVSVESLGQFYLPNTKHEWNILLYANKKNFPYCCHGTLIVQFNNGTHYLASGTLVGERSVLTAAKNLYDRNYDRVVQTVSFFPGSGEKPLEASNARHVIIPEAYIKASTSENAAENDMALVTLDKPLGSYFGHLGLKTFSTEENKYLVLIGRNSYPSPKNDLYIRSGKVVESQSTGKLLYDINTDAIQSGAGLQGCYERYYNKFRDYSYHLDYGLPYCVGVNNPGSQSQQAGFKVGNRGTLFNEEKLSNLLEWMKA